jgi:hypothetical protein
VGLPSLSALGNKSNLRQEAILTSLSVVPHVARKGKHGSTETVATAIAMTATDLYAKSSPRDAPSECGKDTEVPFEPRSGRPVIVGLLP